MTFDAVNARMSAGQFEFCSVVIERRCRTKSVLIMTALAIFPERALMKIFMTVETVPA
jgi:hypothetical protein